MFYINISQMLYLVMATCKCWPCGAQNGKSVLFLSWTSCQTVKCPKLFSSTSRPNLNGFKFSIHDFKALAEPVKMRSIFGRVNISFLMISLR